MKSPLPLIIHSIKKCNSILTKREVISFTCLSWPRRFDKRTIWSLRVFHALASKHSWRISVTAFLVPETSPASLICFSTFNSASISASKLRWASWKFKKNKAQNGDSEVHRRKSFWDLRKNRVIEKVPFSIQRKDVRNRADLLLKEW